MVSFFLNAGEVIEAIIGRGDLQVRIIEMGFGAQGLFFGLLGRGHGFRLLKAQVFEDLRDPKDKVSVGDGLEDFVTKPSPEYNYSLLMARWAKVAAFA